MFYKFRLKLWYWCILHGYKFFGLKRSDASDYLNKRNEEMFSD